MDAKKQLLPDYDEQIAKAYEGHADAMFEEIRELIDIQAWPDDWLEEDPAPRIGSESPTLG